MNPIKFQQKLREEFIRSIGHEPVKNIPVGHTQCPQCGKVYKFSKPKGEGEPWEREQHLGGFCSDDCWPFKKQQ